MSAAASGAARPLIKHHPWLLLTVSIGFALSPIPYVLVPVVTAARFGNRGALAQGNADLP